LTIHTGGLDKLVLQLLNAVLRHRDVRALGPGRNDEQSWTYRLALEVNDDSVDHIEEDLFEVAVVQRVLAMLVVTDVYVLDE
jgi:hypothetical protein